MTDGDDEDEDAQSESTDEDPFESLSADVGDREGDPFDHLDDRGDVGTGARDDEDEEDVGWHPPGGPDDEWSERSMDRDPEADPLGNVGTGPDPNTVGSQDADPDEGRTGDPFESPDSAFQRVELGDVDPEEVWEQLSAAQARGSVAEARKRTYAEVSKHRFCEQCEYFTGPPEVSCTHEGTEILEFPDVEHVRVVDCPIVAEQQALDEE